MLVRRSISRRDRVATRLMLEIVQVRPKTDQRRSFLVGAPDDVNRMRSGKLQVRASQDTVGVRRALVGMAALSKTEQHNECARRR